MKYNHKKYNESSYNEILFLAILSESSTLSETFTKLVSVTKTDSQTSADMIGGSPSLAAFLGNVNIIQQAIRPFAYNYGLYNWYMYNRALDPDELLLMPIKGLSDSFSGLTDTLAQVWFYNRSITDTMSLTDLANLMAGPVIVDFLTCVESFFRIEITNKALNDILRLADWLSIDRRPSNHQWGS
jgi:hypothetical protein